MLFHWRSTWYWSIFILAQQYWSVTSVGSVSPWCYQRGWLLSQAAKPPRHWGVCLTWGMLWSVPQLNLCPAASDRYSLHQHLQLMSTFSDSVCTIWRLKFPKISRGWHPWTFLGGSGRPPAMHGGAKVPPNVDAVCLTCFENSPPALLLYMLNSISSSMHWCWSH